VGDTSIAIVVVQVYDSKEKVVFYLSRRMLDTETRYHKMKKLCLCLLSPAGGVLDVDLQRKQDN
jgi:hypothetical protein